jgi:hypothetical protein
VKELREDVDDALDELVLLFFLASTVTKRPFLLLSLTSSRS